MKTILEFYLLQIDMCVGCYMSKRGSTRFRMAEQRKEREITIEVLARQVPGTVLRKKVVFFFFSIKKPKLRKVQ